MKPELISQHHVVLKLIGSLHKFESDVFWDAVRVSLEILPRNILEFVLDLTVEEILKDENEIRKFRGKSLEVYRRVKSKHKKDEEDDPVLIRENIYNDVERMLTSDHPSEFSRRIISRHHRNIRRDLSNATNPLSGDEHVKFREEIVELIRREILEAINGREDALCKRINTISKYFDLEEFEEKFIYLVFHETNAAGTFLSDFIRSEPEFTKVFAGTNELYEEYNLLEDDDDHPLIQKGLIAYSKARGSLILTKSCMNWILTEGEPDLLDMFLQIENSDSTFALSSFPLEKSILDISQHLLRSKVGLNILIHGKEGTGKTEFAKSISKQVSAKCFFLRPFNKKGKDSISERRMALYIASKVISKIENSILIVDEADDLLSTRRSFSFFGMNHSKDDDKAWVNQFMDKSLAKIIWIANDLNLHRSTARRFNYMINFPDLSHEQMCSMVSKVIEESNIGVQNELNVTQMVDRFSGLTIGSFGTAAKTAENIEGDFKTKKDVFLKVLESHHAEIGDTKPKRNLTKDFNPNFINASYPIAKVFSAIESLLSGRSHLPQLTMLLYGLPGTGKTELVHQIAKKHDLNLHAYGSSDLESKYVGETEKNIAEAFRKVGSNGKSILFIDEADSLFTNRRSAERSWEVSRTNELLRQMENFRGIFVAATNFDSLLDEACLRRFHLKIEMLPLQSDQMLQIYQDKFCVIAGNMSEKEIGRLKGLRNVAFGDIHAVWTKLSYESSLNHAEIINCLESELKWKREKKEIGLHI